MLASREHQSSIEHVRQQAGAHEPQTVRPNDNDNTRKQAGHRKACDVALKMGGDLDDILVMRRHRNEESHFGVRVGGDRFFKKAQPNRDSTHWPQRRWTRFASERRLALLTREIPDMPKLLLTEWHQQGAVSDTNFEKSTTARSYVASLRYPRKLWGP